ncbi:MAG: glycoside hydrolase family 3 N-terminal domain-containing protein [Gemmatimonadota bacterium]
MNHRFLASVMLMSLAGCRTAAGPSLSPTPAMAPAPEIFPVNVQTVDQPGPNDAGLIAAGVERTLDSLSLRDRVAQLVMPWVAGNYAAFDDDAFRRYQGWVDSLHVGGLLVSIGSPLDVAAKLNRLQEQSRFPLLISSDLEAGAAFRLIGSTPFPTNMGVGAAGGELDAYQMGRVTALEGRAVGIQLAFAPVADVNNNPANPIINTRSFGEDPTAVARLVVASLKGMQEHGMLATVKHFPGHGNTGTDSHIALPVITAGWAELDSVELVPFRAAIKAGVAGVMSAHIALPGIDSGRTRPATLNPAVLTGILRDSLKFEGLVVTDALNMGGIVSGYGTGEASVLAILAGTDLLLQPADPGVAIEAVAKAVESGRIARERIDSSVRRVLAIKYRLGLFRQRTVPLDSIPAVVGSAEFINLARDITQRSLVLVRDSSGTVDLLRARRGKITVIIYGDENNKDAGTTLAGELRAGGDTVAGFRLWPASGPASYDSARAMLSRGGTALFAAQVRATAWRGTITLPDAYAALADTISQIQPTVLVSLGSPYLLTQVPHAGSYLLGWSASTIAETAIARALLGQADFTGKLPISLPPFYAVGGGLVRKTR